MVMVRRATSPAPEPQGLLPTIGLLAMGQKDWVASIFRICPDPLLDVGWTLVAKLSHLAAHLAEPHFPPHAPPRARP